MKATVVGYATEVPILQALRHALAEAKEAILCSAFVRRAGVHLIGPQLTTLGDHARLVATSAFGGPSTGEAFGALADSRDPSQRTFPYTKVARRSAAFTQLPSRASR